MRKIKKLLLLIVILGIPYIANAEECPNYKNTYTLVDSENKEIDKKYNIGDKLYLRVSFTNVYKTINQSLSFDSSTFKFIDAKTNGHYAIDTSNLNNITINRTEFSNDNAYVIYSFEVINLNTSAAIEVINQTGICENNQKETGNPLKFTAKLYSSNNDLSSLVFSEGYLDKDFSNSITDYTLTLDKNIKELKILATPKENSSKISGDINTINIENREELKINVASESGATKTFTFKLDYLNKDVVDSPFLKKLITSSGIIEFLPDKYNYSITVPYTTTYIEVNAVPEDFGTTYQLEGNGNINPGDNLIKIITNSSSGKSSTYSINVKRLLEEENNNESDNELETNYLSTLKVENETIQFDKNITDYYLSLSVLNDLKITAIPETSGATVTIQGNSNLQNNSVISIIVTGLNGVNKEYRIFIKDLNFKEDNDQNSDEQNDESIKDNTKDNKPTKSIVIISIITITSILLIILCRMKLRSKK